MRDEFQGVYGDFTKGKCLNIGSGFTLEKGNGWRNLDYNPESGAEIIHDMRKFPWPLEDNSFDCVQASHVMEHFYGDDVIRVAKEVSRILKVGGYFVVAVPYGSHKTAWHNPHHKQRWDESTIGYLCRSQYEVGDDGRIHAGVGAHHGTEGLQYAEWRVAAITFTPAKEWQGKPDAEITKANMEQPNVISEMQFALKLEEK